jgi:multidrug efflux system membrane fusion protein
MIPHRKYVVYAAIVALIAAGLGVFVTSRSHAVINTPGTDSARAIEVDVAQVTSTMITDYQSYFGRTEAIDKVEIRPLVPGTIVGVHFNDGALVNKGDLLFTIDQRPIVPHALRPTRRSYCGHGRQRALQRRGQLLL